MKKKLAIIMTAALLALLAACGTGDIYLHDAPDDPASTQAAEPDPVAAEVTPEPADTLGAPVILNIRNITETYPAPDGSDRIILTFGYDDVNVYLQSDAAAADAINQYLATQDEIYYSGTGNGDGLNGYLEIATDNFALAQDHGAGMNLETSCMRSANVDRADSRIISIRYRTNSYSGGAHGTYFDRAYVFETGSGNRLSFDDLTADPAALEKLVLETMNETLKNDVRYKPIFDYMTSFNSDQNLDDLLKALIRDGSWTLDAEGLTVFSDIYEIGSYADGVVRFTVPYDAMSGILDEALLPPERTADGELRIMRLDDLGSDAIRLTDKVTVTEDGPEFRVYTDGVLYDVSIDSVTYINDDVGFYQTETHWYCSYLSHAGVQVQTMIPEGMPNLMIRYRDAGGDVHSYLITESGLDGTVLLMEESSVVAVG